jgi:hypothetical protein
MRDHVIDVVKDQNHWSVAIPSAVWPQKRRGKVDIH